MKHISGLLAVLLVLPLSNANAFDVPLGELGLSLGGTKVHQGVSQFVGIQDTFGNIHQAYNSNETLFASGISYSFDLFSKKNIDLLFGASVYYLSDAKVNGVILLERTFPNLSYHYETRNIPLYVTAKSIWHDSNKKLSFVADVGVGPNFMKTKNYSERSLDNGVTIPNQAFSGSSEVKFSAMAGLGLRVNNVWKATSIEVGYKYFYLNEGRLTPKPQVLNQLKTGNIDAHALMITFIV